MQIILESQHQTSSVFQSDVQIAKRYSVTRQTVWRWANMKNSNFPKPIKLSPGCTRWKLSDIEHWEKIQNGVGN